MGSPEKGSQCEGVAKADPPRYFFFFFFSGGVFNIRFRTSSGLGFFSLSESFVMVSIIDEIPDDYLKSIGKITVSWSYLEWCIDFLIWALIEITDSPSKGISITAHLNFTVKYNMAMSLAEIYLADTSNKEKHDLIRESLKEADRLRVQRNKICHTAWFSKEDKIFSYNFSARAKLKSDVVSVSIEELNSFSDEVNNCYGKLLGLNQSIISENVEKRKSWLQKLLSQFQQQNQNPV
jgi:hypothetical protein